MGSSHNQKKVRMKKKDSLVLLRCLIKRDLSIKKACPKLNH